MFCPLFEREKKKKNELTAATFFPLRAWEIPVKRAMLMRMSENEEEQTMDGQILKRNFEAFGKTANVTSRTVGRPLALSLARSPSHYSGSAIKAAAEWPSDT